MKEYSIDYNIGDKIWTINDNEVTTMYIRCIQVDDSGVKYRCSYTKDSTSKWPTISANKVAETKEELISKLLK